MATNSRQSSMKFPVVVAALTLLVILVGFGHLGAQLNTIEERLESLPAQSATAPQRATTSPGPATSRMVYVPAYSHVYSKGGLPFLLEVTLSVHNTYPQYPVTLTRADYYDTKGERLRRYVTASQQLAPFETTAFVVEKSDYKGGSGSNFVVEWAAHGGASTPVIEAVMIGVDPEYQISFVRSGVPIEHSAD